MNKTLIKGMLPAVVALGLTGCSAEDSSLGSNTGSIAPEVALDTEVAASARSARSETELTAEDLVLALTKATPTAGTVCRLSPSMKSSKPAATP